jgi:hypothetical protein
MENFENDCENDIYTDVICNPAPHWLQLELPHRVPAYWLDPITEFMDVVVAMLEPDPPESAILIVEQIEQRLQFSVVLDPRLDRALDLKALGSTSKAFESLSAQIATARRLPALSAQNKINGDDDQDLHAADSTQAPMVQSEKCVGSNHGQGLLNSNVSKTVPIFQWNKSTQKDGGRDIGRDGESSKRMLSTVQELRRTGHTRPLRPPPADWRERVQEVEAKFPNFASVVQLVVRPHLAMMEKNGVHRHSPVLLVGQPGIGKTFFANALANTFGFPNAMFVSMASETNGSSLGGSSTFWSNSSPGKLFELLAWGENLTSPAANPLVVLDEIDKVEVDRFNPLGALYTLLEEETAATFRDASLVDVVIDARHVRFYATANDVTKIPEPLLSRMIVFHIDPPSPAQLREVILAIFQSLIGRLLVPMHPALPEEIIGAALTLSPREAKVRLECSIATAISEDRDCVRLSDWPDVPCASQQAKRRGIGFTA